jgi:hypothetical protein
LDSGRIVWDAADDSDPYWSETGFIIDDNDGETGVIKAVKIDAIVLFCPQ